MANGLDMYTVATHEEDLDIDALNDSQLYEKLKENNIVVGPIVDSTREIYKKKLKKVLYGGDEESFVSGGDAKLISDKEDEDEIVTDEEEETVEDGHLAGPIVEEDEEEVVDGVFESQYESKSETDDDQPSGVSRPVYAPSGLRKRTPGNYAESNGATKEYIADQQPDTKSKTSPPLFLLVLLVIVVGAAISIYFLNADMPDTVDSMQEAIQEAANEAASSRDGGEVFTEAANKAASGVDGDEVFTF